MIIPETILQKAKTAGTGEQKAIAQTLTEGLIDSWLSDSNWKVRNTAVKIICELRLTAYTGTLLSFITDRTPAKFFARLLGGDYYQVGFIRRNAAHAVGHLGTKSAAVVSALLTAMHDNYWEVRVEAIRAFRALYAGDAAPEIVQAITNALHDKAFEVVEQAVYALGELCVSGDVLPHFQWLYDHPNVLVKTALMQAIKTLYKRGIITDRNKIENELSNIFIPGKYELNNAAL